MSYQDAIEQNSFDQQQVLQLFQAEQNQAMTQQGFQALLEGLCVPLAPDALYLDNLLQTSITSHYTPQQLDYKFDKPDAGAIRVCRLEQMTVKAVARRRQRRKSDNRKIAAAQDAAADNPAKTTSSADAAIAASTAGTTDGASSAIAAGTASGKKQPLTSKERNALRRSTHFRRECWFDLTKKAQLQTALEIAGYASVNQWVNAMSDRLIRNPLHFCNLLACLDNYQPILTAASPDNSASAALPLTEAATEPATEAATVRLAAPEPATEPATEAATVRLAAPEPATEAATVRLAAPEPSAAMKAENLSGSDQPTIEPAASIDPISKEVK